MPINPYDANANKLTLDDLIADAIEREDADAIAWLETEANTDKTRTRSDSTTYTVKKSIVEIRPAYFKKFLNYKTKGTQAKELAKQKKRDKKQKELDDKFAKARELLAKKQAKK